MPSTRPVGGRRAPFKEATCSARQSIPLPFGSPSLAGHVAVAGAALDLDEPDRAAGEPGAAARAARARDPDRPGGVAVAAGDAAPHRRGRVDPDGLRPQARLL